MQHWAFASAKGLELRIDEIAFECNFEGELHERGLVNSEEDCYSEVR